ncbi:probable 2-oxoglutarate-dependent dioxygenase AOP1 [Diospyros lotus]|uniref:probable 2-oxoglutarate-dependent dioxygenase AOP1 n=1 Tax=Diospyros lotus TaxID=55363 RepID=UPI002252DCCF|nr:probable 2-oxoglutarate-dependent dioxygenase AOP1 [Diospyros lotus]
MGSLLQHKLPVIDLRKEHLKPGTGSWKDARNHVVSALQQYGCFVAVYDGVSQDLHAAVFQALEDLFALPTSTKMQNKSSKPLYGYVGQIPFLPLYESMGIDDANTLHGIHTFSDLMWPNGHHAFSETMLSYSRMVAELEQGVARMVFEEYGVEKYYESHLKSATYLCRVMKYRAAEEEESNMGFVAHTDKSFMTVIHQNQIDGLEIKAKDGQWFSVELAPSSFVVMAGDATLAWSNGRIHSPQHRVSMNGKEARYSVAQFTFMEGTVKAPEELVDEEHPLQFKPFDHLEFLDFYSKPENRRLESALRTYCGI